VAEHEGRRWVDLISVKAVGPRTADRYATEKPVDLGRELARIAGVHRGISWLIHSSGVGLYSSARSSTAQP